jgi:hypothetical protein
MTIRMSSHHMFRETDGDVRGLLKRPSRVHNIDGSWYGSRYVYVRSHDETPQSFRKTESLRPERHHRTIVDGYYAIDVGSIPSIEAK